MSHTKRTIIKAFAVTSAVIFSLSCAMPSLAATQSQLDELKDKRSEIWSQQEEIQTQIDELDTEKNSVLDRKAALDIQNELARQEIELIDEQLDIYDNLLENKSKELEAAKEKENEQTEAYRARVRAMEENNTLSYLSVLFDADSFTDFLSRLHDINDILKYDKTLEEEYIQACEDAEQAQTEYEEIQAQQQEIQSELTEKKAELETQIEEACQLISDLTEDIDGYEDQLEEISAAEAEVQSQINSVIAELETQRKQQEQQNSQNTNTNTSGSTSFVWPTTTTYLTDNYGWRYHPVYKENRFHAGLDIGAGAGAPVYAASSGTVAVATYSSSYGNYIMINHGNGLYTLYAHMSSLAVSAGATVSAGQTIGYVGSTGIVTGPHLHFEVRVNGSTTDPMNYY